MSYSVEQNGPSRSFAVDDKFLGGASAKGDIAIYIGAVPKLDPGKKAILVELDIECLADHVDEMRPEARNVLGFARYRNGNDAPSNLVELVRFLNSDQGAIDAATAMFEAAGLTVVTCTDQPGRIIDRLVRPKYNAALRFLDEGLASAKDMDTTCKLGLGYPDGPIERVLRGGLQRHYEITEALFETFGTQAYAPPRRALAASRRGESDASS